MLLTVIILNIINNTVQDLKTSSVVIKHFIPALRRLGSRSGISLDASGLTLYIEAPASLTMLKNKVVNNQNTKQLKDTTERHNKLLD